MKRIQKNIKENLKNFNENKLTLHSRSANRFDKSKDLSGERKESSDKRSESNKALDFIFFYEVKSSSSSFTYCFEKGLNFFYNQKFVLAVTMFEKSLKLEKNNIYALNNLGVCYLKTKNLSESIKCFHKILQIDRTLEFPYFNISSAYLLFDKFQESVLCVKSAESAIPTFSSKFMQLVNILNSLKLKAFPQSKLRQTSGVEAKISKSMIFSKKVIDDLNTSWSSGFSMSGLDDSVIESEPAEKDPQMVRLQEKLRKKLGKIDQKQIDPGLKLDSKYVTEEELRLLQEEFQKPPTEKNYPKIDEILKKLHFFQQFPLETRQMIYSISSVQNFSQGFYVFRQGEVGETLYVVIKGAISIEKTRPEYGNKKIVVTSLYDGRQFGEVAVLNAIDSETFSNQRSASCIASEQTTVLSIPRDTLSKLILCKNKEELEEKITFLAKTSLFKGFSPQQLLPLALNLDKTCFKLNDVVLDHGELPKGLYLVLKGFLDVVAEENIVKNEKNQVSPRWSRVRAKSPMYFARDPPERPKTHSKAPLLSISQSDISLKHKQVPRPLSRISKEKMTISSIKELEFFGSRVFKKEFSKKQVSKFSVVVQSSKAEILIFTSYHLQFLNQDMHTQFIAIIEKNDDPDSPADVDSKKFRKMFHNWHNYKSQLMLEIQKDSFIERKKKIFPYNV